MIYFIIPARSGSKGVVHKNIKLLNGIPLIGYSIKTASEFEKEKKIIISTDSDEYIEIAKKYGEIIALKRNSLTASDKAKDIDYLLHTIFKLDLNIDDIIILLRPTSPIRKKEVIDDAINKFIESGQRFDSLRSVHPLSEAPEKFFRIDSSNLVRPLFGDDIEITNQPRQNFENAYQPNGYIDIVPVKTVIETKAAFGKKIYGYVTEVIREVDTITDFQFLEKENKSHE